MQQLLRVLVQRTSDLAKAAEEGTLFQAIQPGSPLALADAETKPYQLSHTAQGLIVSSVEHLKAIVDLVQHAPSLHGKPLFTLARSAVEAAATAHWITVDQPENQRLTAFAILETQDARDSATVLKILAKQTSTDIQAELEARDRHVTDLLAKYPPPKDNQQFRTTNMLQVFDQRVASSLHPTKFETFWRSSSGLAHARPWAARTVLIAQPTSTSSDDEVVTVKFVNRVDRLVWLLAITVESVDLAVGAYNSATMAPVAKQSSTSATIGATD